MIAKPTVSNLTLTDADTEYSFPIPAGTRRLRVRNRELNNPIRISFTEGETADGQEYFTLQYGEIIEVNAKMGGSKIYLASKSQAGEVIEIETWQ